METRNLYKLLFVPCLYLSSTSGMSQTFTQITDGPMVNTPGSSRSVNWIDLNDDGFIDCMITNGDATALESIVYINDGEGGFVPLTDNVINDNNEISVGATWGDCDNDGDLDCFVAKWYDLNNQLMFGNEDGSFTLPEDTTVTGGGGYSEAGSWGDYDCDGLLDLYVTNSAGDRVNFLFHNIGNSQFEKILEGNPVLHIDESRGTDWVDINADNLPDIFVANEGNDDERIYKNNGDGTFTSINDGALVNSGGITMSSCWGDIDNDGDLDVFLANKNNDALFLNEGNFEFTEILDDTVVTSGGNSMSCAWSDIDNDADLDLFVTNGYYSPVLAKNFLFLNDGTGHFTRVSNTTPAIHEDWSYGCAFCDYDNDGFQDLAVATVEFDDELRNNLLFHNDGNDNHWISVQVYGTTCNRLAIGAIVRVHATIDSEQVSQMRYISAQSSYCGQNDLRAHFGLSNATQVDSIEVTWPCGGTERFYDFEADQFITLFQDPSIVHVNTPAAPRYESVVFPNPTSRYLNISSSLIPKYETVTYEILDTTGKLEMQGVLQSGVIDISYLPAGRHTIVFSHRNGKIINAFIRQPQD